MASRYNAIGCIDTQIIFEPRFTNELGVVDLVYKIEEREPYLLGELKIIGNTRTKDKVIRREAVMAGLLPGEVLDKNRIEIFQRRIRRSAISYDPEHGQADQDRDRQQAAQGQALWRPDDAAPGRGSVAGADARPGLERGSGAGPRADHRAEQRAAARFGEPERLPRPRSARTTRSARHRTRRLPW